MVIKRFLYENGVQLEKVLIALIFLDVILSFFFKEWHQVFTYGLIVLQILLISLYFLQLETRIYALLWFGFFLGVVTDFIPGLNDLLEFIIFAAPYFAFGIVIMVKAIRMSKVNNNFELLTFVVGFLLVLMMFLPFFHEVKEAITFYNFALGFAIATIIYNDNLWHRYNDDEKNIFKYILVMTMVVILQSSSQLLSNF